MNTAAPALMTDPPADRVLIELRVAWLHLELAQTEITWAGQALRSGYISPRGALQVLDEALGIEAELDEVAT